MAQNKWKEKINGLLDRSGNNKCADCGSKGNFFTIILQIYVNQILNLF